MKNEEFNKITTNNVIISGPSGSGKSQLFIKPLLENAIKQEKPLVILDHGNEYTDTYFEYLKANGYDVQLIDIEHPLQSESWNPFHDIRDLIDKGYDDYINDVYEIITSLIEDKKEYDADPFWIDSAKDVITGISLGLIRNNDKKYANLKSIYKVLSSDFNLKTFFTGYKEVESEYVFACNTLNAPRDTKAGIISVALQKIRLYITRDKLTNLLGTSTINFDFDKKKAIIFNISNERTMYNRLFAAFVIDLLANLKVNNQEVYAFMDGIDKTDTYNYLELLINSKNVKSILGISSSIEKFFANNKAFLASSTNKIEITESGAVMKTGFEKEKTKGFERDNNIKGKEVNYPTVVAYTYEEFNVRPKKEEKEVIIDGPVIEEDSTLTRNLTKIPDFEEPWNKVPTIEVTPKFPTFDEFCEQKGIKTKPQPPLDIYKDLEIIISTIRQSYAQNRARSYVEELRYIDEVKPHTIDEKVELMRRYLKVFDELKDYIDENKSYGNPFDNLPPRLEKEPDVKTEESSSTDLQSLIDRIDAKIAELDAEEEKQKKSEEKIDIDALINKIDNKIAELEKIEQERENNK